MHIIVTKSIFIDSFNSVRPENFNYSGLCALFDYFDDMDDLGGESIELDVIAICCDFTQYTVEDALEAHRVESIEELEELATVLHCDDETIVIQGF
jgi:hypothetical protein